MRPLPMHQIPGREPEPDWHAYFENSARVIQRMVPDMDEILIELCWGDLDLFFVDRKLRRLDGNVSGAYEDLRQLVGLAGVPSYADIQALTQGRAISLRSVCRLRYCLEEARRKRHERLLYLFGIDPEFPHDRSAGIPIDAKKVIPSVTVFDRERYAEARNGLNIQKGELTNFANQSLGRETGRISRKRLNEELFEVQLEQGYSPGRAGESRGFYRLTDHMAAIVYAFLKSKAEPAGYALKPMNWYLPRNTTHGPGNGKWCRSLLRKHGNYWPQ